MVPCRPDPSRNNEAASASQTYTDTPSDATEGETLGGPGLRCSAFGGVGMVVVKVLVISCGNERVERGIWRGGGRWVMGDGRCEGDEMGTSSGDIVVGV